MAQESRNNMNLEVYISPLKFPLDTQIRVLLGGIKYIWETIGKRNSRPPMFKRPEIPITELKEALIEIGVKPDSNLFIHSGIGNIGIIKGGRKKAFETLTNLIDLEKANMVFPTFSYSPTVLKYLGSNPIFDVRESPSFMGSLSQYALKSGLGKRSLHPTHSVLAIGKDEDEIVSTHHLDIFPFGEKSPFFKHMELKNSQILLLGVDMESLTAIHLIEDILKERFPIKIYLDRIFEVKCLNYEGREVIVKTLAHTPFIHLARKTNRFFNILLEHGGIIGHKSVGLSTATLIDARKFFEVLRDLALRGKTVYGRL